MSAPYMAGWGSRCNAGHVRKVGGGRDVMRIRKLHAPKTAAPRGVATGRASSPFAARGLLSPWAAAAGHLLSVTLRHFGQILTLHDYAAGCQRRCCLCDQLPKHQLELADDQTTRALWPYAFRAEITVMLEVDRIDVEFCVENTGSAPFEFTGALHSYLRVVQVEDVALEGLHGHDYLDAALQFATEAIGPDWQLWLENGGVFVNANIRGGSEFGPAWHQAARLLGRQLQSDLGVPVIVENKAGASGTIGGKAVQMAAPDGMTLLFSAATHVLAQQVLANPPYDPQTDFAPVARVGEAPLLLVIPPGAPQNPAFDLFALSEVVRFCISGEMPQSAPRGPWGPRSLPNSRSFSSVSGWSA